MSEHPKKRGRKPDGPAGDPTGKRAKRSVYRKIVKKAESGSFSVQPGMKGILFSCHRGTEKRSTTEVRRLFNEVTEPVEPVDFVTRILDDLQTKGLKRTRYTSRLMPIEDTCFANENDMKAMATKLIAKHFADTEKPETYAIVPKTRNNTKVTRDTLIQLIAPLMPPHTSVNLTSPSKNILVEIFKNICAMSVVDGTDYARLKRFNIENLDGSETERGKDLLNCAERQRAAQMDEWEARRLRCCC
eukprot:jgi/Hompol1/2474/HPOL_000093-RA